MRTLLIFPPASDPAHPPAGLPALAAYLRERGEEVALLDLNVRAYNELLSSAAMARFSDVLHTRLEHFESLPALPAADLKEYRSVVENLLSSDYLIEHADEALARLRERATYATRGTYGEVTAIVRRAMQLVSAAHFPTEWCPGGLYMRYRDTQSREVLAAARDRRESPFLAFFETCLPLVLGTQPELVGISVNYYCQLIPAMTLAGVLRQERPDLPIVVGGGLIAFFSPHWEVLGVFRELVDAWIPFEGEIPLHRLTRLLDGIAPRSRHSLLSVLRSTPIAGVLRFQPDAAPDFTPPPPAPDLGTLSPPRFDGLRLDEYLSPEPILPVLTSRGCYWARCAFCSHGQLYRGRFRSLRTPIVRRWLEQLHAEYGAACFYFVDEAMPPHVAFQLAETIRADSLPFTWFTEARLEARFVRERLFDMARGGCRMLMFGLESAVARVLDHMEKGTRPEIAARILRDCAAAGIRSFVMFFVGFPTETEQEARHTVEFVDSLHDRIAHAAFTQFILECHAPVFYDSERYGVVRKQPFPDEDLKSWWQYDVETGLSPDAAAAVVADIRRNPRIRPLDRPYLVSRSHLAFLPVEQVRTPVASAAGSFDASRPADAMPIRRPWLAPVELSFNLDEATAAIDAASGQALPRRPTQYVFDAAGERLLEIDPDGVGILRACNGSFSLDEILAAVGPVNRESTLKFLAELHERAFIEWTCRQ